MHLMYYLDKNGRRVYTLKVRLSTKQRLDAKAYLLQQKTAPDGTPTYSAHPGMLEIPSVFIIIDKYMSI